MTDTFDTLADDRLVELCREGNAPAFRRLYHRHVDRVFTLVGRILGPMRSDHEDAVQDVFLEVHRSLGRYRGDSAFGTWLYRIAVNTTYSRLRRGPGPRETLADPSVDVPDPAPSGEARTDARAWVRRLYALLEDTSPKNRIVFTLYELEGLTLEQIATLLEIPLHTAAARLRRTRDALLDALRRSAHAGTRAIPGGDR